jgi:hypothetical protein
MTTNNFMPEIAKATNLVGRNENNMETNFFLKEVETLGCYIKMVHMTFFILFIQERLVEFLPQTYRPTQPNKVKAPLTSTMIEGKWGLVSQPLQS